MKKSLSLQKTTVNSCRQFCILNPKLFNNYVLHSGNDICYENKIKVKMKARDFVLNHSNFNSNLYYYLSLL